MKPTIIKQDTALLERLKGHLNRSEGLTILMEGVEELARALGCQITWELSTISDDVKPDAESIAGVLPKITAVLAAVALRSQIDPRTEVRKFNVEKTQRAASGRQAGTPDVPAEDGEAAASGE